MSLLVWRGDRAVACGSRVRSARVVSVRGGLVLAVGARLGQEGADNAVVAVVPWLARLACRAALDRLGLLRRPVGGPVVSVWRCAAAELPLAADVVGLAGLGDLGGDRAERVLLALLLLLSVLLVGGLAGGRGVALPPDAFCIAARPVAAGAEAAVLHTERLGRGRVQP
eukprot:scaffold57774_cov35-Phaeocystis_antarctica.AAC.1